MSRQERSYLADLAPEKSTAKFGSAKGKKLRPKPTIHKKVDAPNQSQYTYRSRAGNHFYGIECEIWAYFGPVGNTEKNHVWPIMSNFLGRFFQGFMGKQIKYF